MVIIEWLEKKDIATLLTIAYAPWGGKPWHLGGSQAKTLLENCVLVCLTTGDDKQFDNQFLDPPEDRCLRLGYFSIKTFALESNQPTAERVEALCALFGISHLQDWADIFQHCELCGILYRSLLYQSASGFSGFHFVYKLELGLMLETVKVRKVSAYCDAYDGLFTGSLRCRKRQNSG
jgi:hypothetical protein